MATAKTVGRCRCGVTTPALAALVGGKAVGFDRESSGDGRVDAKHGWRRWRDLNQLVIAVQMQLRSFVGRELELEGISTRDPDQPLRGLDLAVLDRNGEALKLAGAGVANVAQWGQRPAQKREQSDEHRRWRLH